MNGGWRPIVGRNFLLKIVLIRWWLLSIHHHVIILGSSRYIDLLPLAVYWGFQLDLLIFHSSWIVSLLVHHVYLIIFRVVKVLRCLIEHMDLIDVIHIDLLLHVLCKLDILVKASPSWTGSWISWSLPLPLYTLNDFPSLWVNPAKWIHALAILGENVTPRSSLGWSAIWRCNLLSSRGMLHVLLIKGWGHVKIWVRTGYDWLSLVSIYVMGVFLPLSTNSVKVVMNVQILRLVHNVCYPCSWITLRIFLDSLR